MLKNEMASLINVSRLSQQNIFYITEVTVTTEFIYTWLLLRGQLAGRSQLTPRLDVGGCRYHWEFRARILGCFVFSRKTDSAR